MTERNFKSDTNIGDHVRFDVARDLERPGLGYLTVNGYVAKHGWLDVTITKEPVRDLLGFFESLKHDRYNYDFILPGYRIIERAKSRT